MLHTKFQENRSHTFREDFLNVLPYMGVAVIKIICIIYIFIPFNLIRPNIRSNFNWPGSFFCVNEILNFGFK